MTRLQLSVALLLMALLACCCLPHAASAADEEHANKASHGSVKLRLKWTHQFQFAGCYMALEKGFFSDAGLDVQLIEGKRQRSAVQVVLDGDAEYGIGGPEILRSRLQGSDLVVLAVIMQQSPSALIGIGDQGWHSLQDLQGRQIMLFDDARSLEIIAMLHRAGLVENEDFSIAPAGQYSMDRLVSGEIAAVHGYVTSEPYAISEAGHPPLVFNPTDYGISFYGDSLFTTEREITEHPERVLAMRRALLRGWQYALDNPHETIDLIQQRYNRGLSEAELRAEAQAISELIAPSYVEIGQMSEERWARMADVLEEMDVVIDRSRLKGFSYQDHAVFNPEVKALRNYVLGILLAALLVLGLMLFFNMGLREAVRFRTAELTDLNAKLSSQLEEHRRVMAELEESRRDYAEAQRIAKVGNWSYDCLSGRLEWSDEVYRIYGLTEQISPSLADALEITHEHDRSLLRSGLRDAIRDGSPGSIVRRIHRGDGEIGYVNTVFEPVINDRGRTVELRGTVQDVTEIRQAEEARQESERAYNALFDNSIELIFLFAADGTLLDANQSMLQLIRAAEDDGGDRTDGESGRSQLVARLWEVFGEQGLSGGDERSLLGMAVLDAQGRDGWIEGYGVPLQNDDGVYAVLCVARDVTDRRRVEQAAMEVERKYQSLFDNSVEMIFVLDSEGRFLEANDNALNRFGYGRSDLPGLRLRDIMDDAVHERAMRSVREVMEGERPGELQEYRAMTRLGQQVWFESAGVRLERDGRPWAVLTVARDITDRKQAESERRSLEAQLRQTQKLEAIGTLAGGIAHDFNNLLFAIRGNADLALTLPDDEENTRECLSEILAASNRATELVQQILSFARKSDVEMRVVDLNDIFREVLRLIRATIPANIEIVTELGDQPNLVYGDVTQMHQMMMNLCSNAGYAMREKGGRLTVKLSRYGRAADFGGRVLDSRSEYLLISVEDTGTGISEKVRERIFEPFFTTKGMGEGTGMGLSAVHGIVTAMNGAIDVMSTPGVGTTFKILLPLAQAGMLARAENSREIPRGSERVLVVDDEEAIVRVMHTSLSNLGYAVTACTESAAALETFRSSPQNFDLVISDQAMPGLTGNQLAAQISSIRNDLPIIICSGNNTGNSTEEGRRNGVSMFLHKPVERRELAEAIRSLLD